MRSQIGYDLRGWFRFSFTGLPLVVGGVGEHHVPIFKERRTPGSVCATSEGTPRFKLTCANPSAPVTVQKGSASK